MVLAPNAATDLAPDAPSQHETIPAHSFRHGDGKSTIRNVELLDTRGQTVRSVQSGDLISVRVKIEFHEENSQPMVGILIRNRNGLDVFGTNTRVEGASVPAVHTNDIIEFLFTFSCRLPRNEYTLTVASQNFDGISQDWRDDALSFSVANPKEIAGLVELETAIQCRRIVDAPPSTVGSGEEGQ